MVGAVLSLFLLVTKRLYGKEWEWSIGQIKTCRKKQHVKIDDIKEMSDLICGKAAVGGNYNSTRDNKFTSLPSFAIDCVECGKSIPYFLYIANTNPEASAPSFKLVPPNT